MNDLDRKVECMMKSGKYKIGSIIHELQKDGYLIEDINASLNLFNKKYMKVTNEYDT